MCSSYSKKVLSALAFCTFFLFSPITHAGDNKKGLKESLEARRRRIRERQLNSPRTPASTSVDKKYHHDLLNPKYAIIAGAQRLMVGTCACPQEHHPHESCTPGTSSWQTYATNETTKRLMLLICTCPTEHSPSQPCTLRSNHEAHV